MGQGMKRAWLVTTFLSSLSLLVMSGCSKPCDAFDCERCGPEQDHISCRALVRLGDQAYCKRVREAGGLATCR